MHLVMCTALCSRTSCCRTCWYPATPSMENVLIALLHTVAQPTLDDILHGMQWHMQWPELSMQSSVYCSLHYILLSSASCCHPTHMAFLVVLLSVWCLGGYSACCWSRHASCRRCHPSPPVLVHLYPSYVLLCLLQRGHVCGRVLCTAPWAACC